MSKVKGTRRYLYFLIAGMLVIAIFLANMMLGSVTITLREMIDSFLAPQQVVTAHRNIILKIRLPRILAAMASGSFLGVAGLLLQIFFNNPIVEPYILGISSGANLVLALMLLGGYSLGLGTAVSNMSLVTGAFLGAMFVMVIVIFASQKVQSVTTLLIIGLMMGYICSAITSVLTVLADKEQLAGFTIRTMGSFAGFTWESVGILYVIGTCFLIGSFLLVKPLNTLLLGEHYAQSLGTDLKKIRWAIVLIASVLTAIVTAFAGAVSFIGLAVPHIARMLFKTSDNRVILPAVCLLGAIMAGGCDLGARLLLAPTELPIGALTSLIGAPIVIRLLVHQKRGGW